MLRRLVDRLFSRPPPRTAAAATEATTAARPSTAAAGGTSATTSLPTTTVSVSPAQTPRPPGPPPIGLGARRPLVASNGALAGFEFHAGAAGRSRLRRVEDEVTVRACTANVLGAMRLCIGQGLVALAEFPAIWLARGEDAALCAGMYLVLAPDAVFDDAEAVGKLLARLRQAGTQVGWRADLRPGTGRASPATGIAADFLVVPAPPLPGLAGWRAAGAALAASAPGVAQVLLDLPNVDVMEAMLGPAVLLAACVPGAPASTSRAETLSPQASRLLQLLSRLVRDDDHALVIADIKADAALGLRLLQYANSPGVSPGHVLASVDQAVSVLGRDVLYHWAAQALVRLSAPRGAATALQAMALARARLLESLARSVGDASPGSLYLFGLVSMLPLLLNCSLDDAVDSLQLPPAALDALHRQHGPWHPYLALAMALDRQDLAQADLFARDFNGLDAVLVCSTRAWLPGEA